MSTPATWDAAVYLENGLIFEGQGFGAKQEGGGEAVFNTGMSGYQEIFTDPSYYKQIVVMTYPHLGNTGINAKDVESKALYLSGVVCREYCGHPSNWRSTMPLSDYLEQNKIPAISGVETRRLTQVLRSEGAQRAVIFPVENAGNKSIQEYGKSVLEKVPSMEGQELVSLVSTKKPYVFAEGNDGSVVVYDFGVKAGILQNFADRGYRVHVVPHHFPFEETLSMKPQAVVLSNGPGDPERVTDATTQVSGLVGRIPILAICMGHQLLARALGCSTYKLKFGHHGINHPVKDTRTGKVFVTSQNHGFSVSEQDLRRNGLEVGQVSLNDGTVEGFFSEKQRLLSVQFHPESKPGPHDSNFLFDSFLKGFVR